MIGSTSQCPYTAPHPESVCVCERESMCVSSLFDCIPERVFGRVLSQLIGLVLSQTSHDFPLTPNLQFETLETHTHTATQSAVVPFSLRQFSGMEGEYWRRREGAPRPTGFSALTLSHTGKR